MMQELTMYDCYLSQNAEDKIIKKRMGKPNDGGYVIAMLENGYDILIAGGISNDISFEDDILKLYPELNCLAFDGTIPALPYEPESKSRLQFIPKNLGNVNTDECSNLVQEVSQYKNIFMKIDIEGHEFRLFPELFAYMNNIKQLVLEIHTPADIQLFPDYFKGLSDITNTELFNLFSTINKTHTLIHFHANNGCNLHQIDGITVPNVFECTFIRNDQFIIKSENTSSLPTNIDMPNIPSKPEIFIDYYPFVTKPN